MTQKMVWFMNKILLWMEDLQLGFLANGILKLEKKFEQMNLKLVKAIEREEVKHDESARKRIEKIIELENKIDEDKVKWNDRKSELNSKRSHVIKVKKVLGGE